MERWQRKAIREFIVTTEMSLRGPLPVWGGATGDEVMVVRHRRGRQRYVSVVVADDRYEYPAWLVHHYSAR